MNNMFHQEIGGGYAVGPKIIVDTCEIKAGVYETMAMKEDGEEIESRRTSDVDKAEKDFYEILLKYSEPLQKAVVGAKMKYGKRYTLFRLSEFGFPMAYQFTYKGYLKLVTYAQYRDVVKFEVRPAGKRGDRSYMLYNCSFAIVEGWQDLPRDVIYNKVYSNAGAELYASKYACFDARYFEDIKKVLKNVLVVYENYRIGVDGRVYA